MFGRKKIMSNLIKGEWYKLRKSRYFFGMIFLAVTLFYIKIWDHIFLLYFLVCLGLDLL
jgi:hypothetical protein